MVWMLRCAKHICFSNTLCRLSLKARLAKRRRKQRNRKRKGTEQKREKEKGDANKLTIWGYTSCCLSSHSQGWEYQGARGSGQPTPTACFPLHGEPTMGTCTSQNRSTKRPKPPWNTVSKVADEQHNQNAQSGTPPQARYMKYGCRRWISFSRERWYFLYLQQIQKMAQKVTKHSGSVFWGDRNMTEQWQKPTVSS